MLYKSLCVATAALACFTAADAFGLGVPAAGAASRVASKVRTPNSCSSQRPTLTCRESLALVQAECTSVTHISPIGNTYCHKWQPAQEYAHFRLECVVRLGVRTLGVMKDLPCLVRRTAEVQVSIFLW